jgi:hypothetical protein
VSRHPFHDVAIVGAANTAQARSLAGHTSLTIAFAAAQQVMADTGVAVGDIDGVFGERSGELEEGYRMLAAVADCTPEDLADGLALVADFQATTSGQRLPFFRPAEAGQ